MNRAIAIAIRPRKIGLVSNFSIVYTENNCRLNPSTLLARIKPINKDGRLRFSLFIITPITPNVNSIM